MKAKLEQTTAAKVQFEQTSKAELDDVKAKLEQTTAAKVQFEQTSKAELDDVKEKLKQTTAAKVQFEQTSKAELDDVKAKLEQTTAAKVQFEQISKAELDDVKAKLEQTTAAKVQFEQTSKAELGDVKAKLEQTTAAKVQFEQTSKAELDDVKAKLEQTTAAKVQFEQTSKAELDDVKAKLEQTTAAKVQFEQTSKAELDDVKAKLEETTAANFLLEQILSKAELDDVKAKLEEITAAKFLLEFEETSKAELDDVKAKLEKANARATVDLKQMSRAEVQVVKGPSDIGMTWYASILSAAGAGWCFLWFVHLRKTLLEQDLQDITTRFEQTSAAKAQPEETLEDDFPVKTFIQDDWTVITVQCPGVKIQDIRVEYCDGPRQGKIQIDRKEALGVQPLQWEHPIHFDSPHEFVPSETRPGAFLFWCCGKKLFSNPEQTLHGRLRFRMTLSYPGYPGYPPCIRCEDGLLLVKFRSFQPQLQAGM